MKKLYTSVYVRNGSSMLLGYKKRGFGQGKWYGFGGKVEPGESIVTAAIRELNEECSLKVEEENLLKVAVISFEFLEDPGQIMEVHVFTSKIYQGEPEESDEMRPKWYDNDNLPFPEMWAADKIWFPLLLSGTKFVGSFTYLGNETIASYSLKEVFDLS